jgi:hypothetical protein
MMNPRRKLLSYLLFSVGVILLVGSALIYFHTRQTSSANLTENVPEIVADLPLVQLVTGQEAIDRFHQLHGQDFRLVDGIVAVYGNQNVTLWVADAGSSSGAADLIELMYARIADGNSPFTALGDLYLNGLTVYALDGMGQAHYYWRSGNLVVWLAAGVPVAQQAILESIEFYR